jgi:adenine-specific DNA-methyltransferase
VNLMLDLSAYVEESDLAAMTALEPAAGEGAFAFLMAKRLIESCRRHHRPMRDAKNALRLFEIDAGSALLLREKLISLLNDEGIDQELVAELCDSWIIVGDYLKSALQMTKMDFVIGNPPYIRLEDLDDSASEIYRILYPTMRGRADIYVGFFEAALRQLKPDGVCSYICADRWMRNQYGTLLRALIHRSFAADWVLELHQADAFDDEVDAYPAITVIRRRVQEFVNVATVDSAVCLEDIHFRSIEPWFEEGEPWPNGDPVLLSRISRWNKELPPLEDEQTGTVVGIGVASGADKIFVTKQQDLVEESRLLPLAMGGDVCQEGLAWSGHYLVNPWDEDGLVELSQYPQLRAYIEYHADQLRGRHVGKRSESKYFRTIDRVDCKLTSKAKLYIPDIRARLAPVLDRGTTYPHHNLYFIISKKWDLEVLGGILLSDQAQSFISAYAMKMRGGFYRYQAQYLRRIRVPNIETLSCEDIAGFKSAFLLRDVEQATQIARNYYQED